MRNSSKSLNDVTGSKGSFVTFFFDNSIPPYLDSTIIDYCTIYSRIVYCLLFVYNIYNI